MAKNSLYDKPATEWTDKEIEVEKLRLEASRARAEGSIGRRYGTIILSGVLAVAGSLLTYYTNMQADARASQEQREETERTLAQNAVRVYFENPERFDLKTDEGRFNLRVLADTAPGKTTATLVSQIQDNAVQVAASNAEIAAAAPTAAAAVAAPNALAPTSAAPAANFAEAKTASDNSRYDALQNVPSLVQDASKPGDFKIYIQYGSGAQGQALEAQKKLKDLGYGAPSTEMVRLATDKPELRYYRAGQAKLAEELAMQMKDVVGDAPRPVFVGANRQLPDGVMELWLPPQGVSAAEVYSKSSGYLQNRLNTFALERLRQQQRPDVRQQAPAQSAPQ